MRFKYQPETIRVSSFDIFGTLLLRKEGRPAARLQIAYESLGLSGRDLLALVRLRLEAEQAARQRYGPDLYSLENVYQEMEKRHDRGKRWSTDACAVELAMERQQCFASYAGKRLLEEASNKTTVIYVTDMYLPSAFIRELLQRNYLWTEGASLFVSHEEGCAKHSGLFAKILRKLKVSPDAVLHVGDSWEADVRAPRRHGIWARHFQGGAPSRYEIRLVCGEASSLAQASRVSRLGDFPERRGASRVAWETACDVIAPLFIPYVHWVACQAAKRKLERLYFVSRDGLIFKKIYDVLKSSQPAWPESCYLYGSRQAWSCIRAAEFQEKDLDFFLYEKRNVSFFQVFRRIGFSGEEVVQLALPGWFGSRLHQVASSAELKKFKQLLMEPAWVDQIRSHGAKRVASAQEYLRQEGMFEGKVFGLVDLGWGGNLQTYVDRILHPCLVPYGFYFHLTRKTDLTESGRALCWLPQLPFHGWDEASARAVLEIFCSANHGMTLGYCKTDVAWEPVLAPLEPSGPELQLASSQHGAIQVFAQSWMQEASSWSEHGKNAEPQLAAVDNLKNFILSPGMDEAETYGATRLTSRQEGGDSDVFGPAFTLAMAWGAFGEKFSRRETHWPGGIIRRSRGVARGLVWLRFCLARVKSYLQRSRRSA